MSEDYRKKIGGAIKKYRLAAHMSQMALAEKIGISYQQLQKYEKGINNLSLYRLKQICEALYIPISTFLEGHTPEKIAEEIGEYGMNEDERILINLFRKIQNKDIRRGLLLELKGIVEETEKK
jgi:transcriptional regulator with XRE-family HTH domain